MLGKLGDGLMGEQLSGTEFDPGLVGAGHDLDGDDGVTTQFEEVIVDTHLFDF